MSSTFPQHFSLLVEDCFKPVLHGYHWVIVANSMDAGSDNRYLSTPDLTDIAGIHATKPGYFTKADDLKFDRTRSGGTLTLVI
jgi:hypothetical protein